MKAENGTIGLGTGFYASADNCQGFYVDNHGNISQSSVAGIATDETDAVDFKITDGEVTTIVITQVISPAKTMTGIKYQFVSTGAEVPAAIVATGTVRTPANDHEDLVVKIVDVTVAPGATWAVSGTATVAENAPAAANQITVTVTAEDGTTQNYVIGFQDAD